MVMLGLTYRPGETWHKLDISHFMLSIRKLLGKKLLAYAWVSELQERGEVHYHVIVVVPKKCYVPFPDKSGLWKHGATHYSDAKSPFYIVSYTKKKLQKNYSEFPAYCHAFAVWISDSVMSKQLRVLRMPAWKREILSKYGEEQFDELVQWHKEDMGWGYRQSVDYQDAEGWAAAYMWSYATSPPDHLKDFWVNTGVCL